MTFDGVVLGDLATPLEVFVLARNAEGRPCYEERTAASTRFATAIFAQPSKPQPALISRLANRAYRARARTAAADPVAPGMILADPRPLRERYRGPRQEVADILSA